MTLSFSDQRQKDFREQWEVKLAELDDSTSERIRAAGKLLGARTIPEAEQMYSLPYGESVFCSFCGSAFIVSYEEVDDEHGCRLVVPSRFVFLPAGYSISKADPGVICEDCFVILPGLPERHIQAILKETRARAQKSGEVFDLALQRAILSFCYVNFPMSGDKGVVREVVRRQIESYEGVI